MLKINQHSDLARMGVIRELSFSIIPLDPAKGIPPYGMKYNTSVPYAVSRPTTELIDEMYAFEFKFTDGREQISYRIEPQSIKERRRKNTSPNFS